MKALEYFNGRARFAARPRALVVASLLLGLGLPACGSAGEYVWVDKLPAAQLSGTDAADYVIKPGDLLNIRVYNQEPMSTRARVRPDGKIFIPLVVDVEVKGRRPAELAKDLEG